MTRVLAALAAGASGVVYAAAGPATGAWPLAFACLAPLLCALRGATAGQRARLGGIAGTVAAVASVGPMLAVALTRLFDVGLPLAALAAFALGELYGALPFALFAVACGDPARSGPLRFALRCACAWSASESLRGALGFPWAFLAHSLAPAPLALALAALGGEALVSFWLAASNAALAGLLRSPGPSGALALVLLGLGALPALMVPPEGSPEPARRVRIVQPALAPALRRDLAGPAEALERLVALSVAAGEGSEPVDLLVWPENAWSWVLPANHARLAALRPRLSRAAAALLFGAPTVADADPARFRNSALLLDTAGGAIQAHHKVILLPFVETAPAFARDFLPGAGHYQAGAEPRVLDAGGLRIGPMVCFETAFAGLARRLVAGGAEVLVSVSNDSWLDGSAGREQHFATAVLRAVESRRWLVRSTQTGVSAAIDPWGRVAVRLTPDQATAATIALEPRRDVTAYARFGHGFVWLAALGGALALGAELVRGGRRG